MIGIIYLLIGIILLYFSGDWLVSGSNSLAKNLKIQPFVIALTIVAFGTSAPELAISINSAIKGHPGITIGNIVGSNIANVLFALPLAFLLKIPKKSDVKKIDCAFLFITTLFFIFILIYFNKFDLISGLLMLFILVIYIIFIILETFKGKRKISSDETLSFYSFKKSAFILSLGLIGIILGSEVLVSGAVITAKNFGISEAIIGLTIVALGTSIPEVVTTMVAARRGQTDFILGAILGSNLFNLLAISGIASIITELPTNNILNNIDIFFLILSTVAFILVTNYLKILKRRLVLVMLISYLIYVLFIYLRIV